MLRRIIISVVVFTLLLTMLGVTVKIGNIGIGTPAILCPPGSGTPVTISVGPTGPPLYPQVSTTVDSATYLMPTQYSGAPTVLRQLAQWQPPLVRLHFGFHGITSLPESRIGQWDFTRPDTAITNMRAQHTTFILNVRSAPPFMFNSFGKLRDSSFHEYAVYLARLVGWYNKGGFTDDNGVYHRSSHSEWIHTWEIWNEPSSSGELPVPVPDKTAQFLDPVSFARLFNTVVAAMRAVDPTIIVGGPAINGHTPTAWSNYIGPFVQNLTQPLAFISFHMYPTGVITDTDLNVLNTLNSRLPAAIANLGPIAGSANHGHGVPIWLDEAGWSESSRLPVDPRDNSRISYAFIANSFYIAVNSRLGQYDQFPLLDISPGGLMDLNTATVHNSFYLYELIGHTLPSGSTLLPLKYSNSGLKIVAALSPDHRTIHVLLGNTTAAHPWDNNGYGVGQRVCLVFRNTFHGIWIPAKTPAKAWIFDQHTRANTMPTPDNQGMLWQPVQALITTYVPGYSAMDIEIPVK
jgi:hypothetical protein